MEYTKKYSKIFKQVCNAAKSNFIRNKIKNSSNAIKTTWKIINNETGNSKCRETSFKLHINDRIITDNFEIAETFNSFFNNIPVRTTESLKSSPSVALSLLRGGVTVNERKFAFEKVTDKDIIKAFKSIENKSTMDVNGISVKMISCIVENIAPCLATIFNVCIDSGEFPDLMKHSKIIPLFKSGIKTDPTNYRPISILPALSKIYEKVILQQLIIYFNRSNLMTDKQFGFTKGRSTTDAGVEVVKFIFDAWERSRDVVGIFCDLSKAFDCVHHDTLIGKLRHYGIEGRALDLMVSYLSSRIQKVDVNGAKSTGSTVTMGVPQGSILGPFLFLVYINDLTSLINNKFCEAVLFADDTSVLFNVDRHSVNLDEVNSTVSKVVEWFTANNLMLNEKKTKYVRFSLPNVKKVDTQIIIKDGLIDKDVTTVFLGITLDSNLQWGPHITKLEKRLSSAACAVKKIRHLTDVSTARTVYFSYFHSIMSYGILLWGNAADINSIFVLQKRAVRAIYKLGPRESLRDKFKEINILTVTSQYIYENLVYAKKNVDFSLRHSDIHVHNTRNKNKIIIPASRLSKIKKSFPSLSIRFYNTVPEDIQNLSMNKFKSCVKSALIRRAYYCINDFLNDDNPWKSVDANICKTNWFKRANQEFLFVRSSPG